MEQLKALTMKVGEQPEMKTFEVKEENDTYNVVSNAVGGYIEALRITDTCVLWINEEGKLQELDPNFVLTDRAGSTVDFVAGNVIFTGIDEEGYTVSLKDEDLQVIQERFSDRFHFKYYA